jgi:hypothetical protein
VFITFLDVSVSFYTFSDADYITGIAEPEKKRRDRDRESDIQGFLPLSRTTIPFKTHLILNILALPEPKPQEDL